MAGAGSRRGRPKRGAVIDLGSNALRLQIVERIEGGEPVVLTRHRAPVRLGKDVYAEGRIGPETLDAAEAALRRFADLCEQYGAQRIRAVATAALREAANRDAVVERLSAVSPVPIEVITGTEEAWLLARAVETRVDLAQGRSLLLDLGGGSVEAILVEDGRAVAADSYPLGAIRLLEAARRQSGSAHGATFKALLEQHAGACDHSIAERMAARPLDRLVACGGSVEVLADLAKEAGRLGSVEGLDALECEDLERWILELEDLSPEQRVARFGMLPDRADVILPAAVVVRHLAELAGARRVLVPRVGLRDGLERDVMAGPEAFAERRETLLASAGALARRYHCDLAHGERVRVHAVALFDATASLHGRGPEDRALLEAAALLHDAGRFIASESHQVHSAYLIAASELVGVSSAERDRIAQVAGYHRGPHPSEDDAGYARLDSGERAGVCVLAALLRLADALDRQHRGAVGDVAVRVEGGPGRVTLVLHGAQPGSLELHAVRDKGRLFEEVFGVSLGVETA